MDFKPNGAKNEAIFKPRSHGFNTSLGLPRKASSRLWLARAIVSIGNSLLGTEPDLYGLKLAQKIGVTKSAASQLLSKLEKRGMICSHVASDKLTKRTYSLTEEGWKVFHFHEKIHNDFERRFSNLLRRYTPEQRRFLKQFVQDLNDNLNNWFDDDLEIL